MSMFLLQEEYRVFCCDDGRGSLWACKLKVGMTLLKVCNYFDEYLMLSKFLISKQLFTLKKKKYKKY